VIAAGKAMVYRAIAQTPAQCAKPKSERFAFFQWRSQLSQHPLTGERFAFFGRRALQLLGWYAILVESSGLSVARRSTKTNYN